MAASDETYEGLKEMESLLPMNILFAWCFGRNQVKGVMFKIHVHIG
jgi:hypothetical protein